MAISFFATEISDLCLGKPPLRSLPTTATVAEAVTSLKQSGEAYVTIWSNNDCVCVGKICMVDVIVYLCKEENLVSPVEAVRANVLDVVSKVNGQIRHLESNSRFVVL